MFALSLSLLSFPKFFKRRNNFGAIKLLIFTLFRWQHQIFLLLLVKLSLSIFFTFFLPYSHYTAIAPSTIAKAKVVTFCLFWYREIDRQLWILQQLKCVEKCLKQLQNSFKKLSKDIQSDIVKLLQKLYCQLQRKFQLRYCNIGHSFRIIACTNIIFIDTVEAKERS